MTHRFIRTALAAALASTALPAIVQAQTSASDYPAASSAVGKSVLCLIPGVNGTNQLCTPYQIWQASGAGSGAGLVPQPTSTVLGNGSGATATPTPLTLPSCFGSNQALIWTGTTFGCNTIASSGSPGGASGQLQINSGGAFGGLTATGYLYGNGSGAVSSSTSIPGSAVSGNIAGNAAGITGTYAGPLTSAQVTSALTLPSCGGSNQALSWSGATFGCNTIASSGSPGGVSGQLQINSGGAFGGLTATGYLYGNGSGAVSSSTSIPGSAVSGNIAGNAAGITGTYSGPLTSAQVTSALTLPSCGGSNQALSWSGATFGCNTIASSGSPGGVSGQLQINSGGAFGGLTATGYLYGNGSGAVSSSTSIPGSAVSGNIAGNAAGITGTYSGPLTSAQVTSALGGTPLFSNPSTLAVGGCALGAYAFCSNSFALGYSATFNEPTLTANSNGNITLANSVSFNIADASGVSRSFF